MLSTSLLSDGLGRRWLTLGLFGSGAVAILAIGIVGSFDYQSKELGGLLVGKAGPFPISQLTAHVTGILGVCVQFRSDWWRFNRLLVYR